MARFLRSDLPVAADPGNRFLPLLVAAMVFLATLALAGALALQDMTTRWRGSMTGTLTVQVPPVAGESSADTVARVDRVVRLLASLPEVAAAVPVADEQLVQMLQPWLGSDVLIADLPVPRLVDVSLKVEAMAGLDAMLARVRDVAPGALIDDHRVWLARLIALADGIRLLAWATLGLVGTATTAAVVYATRSGLAVHRPHIEVLHLIGATDGYVARQFARRALIHGLIGGAIGTLMAAPALIALLALLAPLEGGLVPVVTPASVHFLGLALLPLLAGGVVMITAYRTVRRQLARML
ncbi:cell division protein FtsX [Novispirillum itersonii]|uniref:Cell division transport system permease protein n=1 Tax=Novispirillum itersonii TaxID=189 RepID=A0A7X0DMC4_NOVIT|nr:FtsX-like permease family protein [Novispirillum itersonii]MBB6209042.1 cell division transport system permease protein [Novispirillum itersonii]